MCLGFRVLGFTVGALGLVFFGFRVLGVGGVRVFELSCPVGSRLTNFNNMLSINPKPNHKQQANLGKTLITGLRSKSDMFFGWVLGPSGE